MRAVPLRCALLMPAAFAVAAAQSEAPRLEDVLRIAGQYVAGYERSLGIVAAEDYSQQVDTYSQSLHSEILFIKDETHGWMEFRDVMVLNGRPVRDREERLLALFTKPNPDRLKQAQRIVSEGARFNLHPIGARVNRTINLPLTALRFLRTEAQYRSSFRIAGWNEMTGMATLEFREQRRPRLIGTGDNAAAAGRFEIDSATGRPASSRLTLQTGTAAGPTRATVAVRFEVDTTVGLAMPREMTEEYRGPFVGVVTGAAKYSHYRRFDVETSESVGK